MRWPALESVIHRRETTKSQCCIISATDHLPTTCHKRRRVKHTEFGRIDRKILIGILIFFAALAVRLFYVETTEFIDPIRADAKKYFFLAINLANQGIYSTDIEAPFSATTTITPGYPLFLVPAIALADSLETSFRAILIIQSLLGALGVLLLYLLSLRALPSHWAAAFGFILALLPHHIVFGGYVLTETWFMLLFIASIYALIRHMDSDTLFWLFLAGLLCGMAALTRPAALMLMPFIAAIQVFVKAMRMDKAAILIVATMLPWIPWQLWVQQTASDSHEKHSQFAAVLAFGSYPDFVFKTDSMRGYPYREDPEYPTMSASTGNAIAIILERAKAEPGRYLYWYSIGKPISYWSWNMMESVGGPFIYPVGSNFWTHSTPGQIALAIYHGLHRLLLLAGSPVLLFLFYSMATRTTHQHFHQRILSIATLTILYFTIVHLILAAWPRYAVPFWPFFYLLGMCGLYQLTVFLRQIKTSAEVNHGHT